MPPPRSDTPLDPAQVQQATEDLINARNHLSAETQGSGQSKPPANTANQTAAKTGERPVDKKKQQSVQAAAVPGPTAAPGSGQGASEGMQTSGAEAKP
jgi:hypothetical protein